MEVLLSFLSFLKFHSLSHISESTRKFGTPDNTDTEVTEHQYHTDVKTLYRQTNKRNPLPQVVKFIEHQTPLNDALEHIGNKSVDTPRYSITESYRHLNSPISKGTIHINDGSKMFNIHDLELAIQTFFHDLQYSGEGNHHRVSKRNLPKLMNPIVSLLIYSSVHK